MDMLIFLGGFFLLLALYIGLMIQDEMHRTSHCKMCGKELTDVSETSLCNYCHGTGI